MRLRIRDFSKGLRPACSVDDTPPNALRRARGVSPTSMRRSRFGSTLIHEVSAISIYRYNDVWFYGDADGNFYRSSTTLATPSGSALDGTPLIFLRMPPTVGKSDYLFCCGGGELFKISTGGTATKWGIDSPASGSAFAAAPDSATGSLTGDYYYKVTFRNSTSGHRSNGSTGALASPAGQDVALSDIAVSTDSQVDNREIWRTTAGGSTYYLLTTLADNSTTAYTDDIADANLGSTELPTDNLSPQDNYHEFNKVAGPFNASCFWISNLYVDSGRVFYSSIGRPEAVEGYLEVSSPDDPLQGLITWQGILYAISQSGWFQIHGTNPYISRALSGIPGTNNPLAVSVTPYGIVYEAPDGVRIFNGSVSKLISPDGVVRLWRGESFENLVAFTGDRESAYARGEYIISDNTQTLAVNLESGAWRDLGLGANALYYADDSDILALATTGGVILDFEDEGTTQDNATDIAFSLETAHFRLGEEEPAIIQHVHVDSNCNSESLTVYAITDTTTTLTLGTMAGTEREVSTFNVNRAARIIGIRITGSLDAAIEIYGIDIDYYLPGEEK